MLQVLVLHFLFKPHSIAVASDNLSFLGPACSMPCVSFSVSKNNQVGGVMIENMFNLGLNLQRIGTLYRLSLPIHKHIPFLHLYSYSLISLNNIL